MTDKELNTLMGFALEGVQALNGIRADLHALADGLSGVVNVIDMLDTNLGNHLGAIRDEIEESNRNVANQVAGLSGGVASSLRRIEAAIEGNTEGK